MIVRHWVRHRCPHCGTEQSAVASSEHIEGPQADDATICINCTNLSIFNKDGSVRKPTLRELATHRNDPDIDRMVVMAKLAKRALNGTRR